MRQLENLRGKRLTHDPELVDQASSCPACPPLQAPGKSEQEALSQNGSSGGPQGVISRLSPSLRS